MSAIVFRGCDDLREWVIAQGFKVAENHLLDLSNECNWYAYRRSALPARECECNDGKPMQLVVKPFRFANRARDGTWASAEVEVVGEVGGDWFNLSAYGVDPVRLKTELPAIEKRLIDAWNALVPLGA
jgi:hypothetical protein